MDAVIDIGSNSVRLCYIVGEVCPKIPATTFLAEGLTPGGNLLDEAIERTNDAVVDFYNRAKARGCENVFIYATEAVRSAANGIVLTQRIFDRIGATVDVISGNDEALCGFVGATNGRGGCIIDLGGASMEMTEGKDSISTILSIPNGVRRAFDACGGDRKKTHAYYQNALSRLNQATMPVIGIGGTIVTLSAMLNEMQVYDALKNHGTRITLLQLERMEEYLYSFSSLDELILRNPVLDEKRATVIATGCVAFVEILKKLNADYLTVSEADGAEGYYKLFCNKN